jgi:hypothetical protein
LGSESGSISARCPALSWSAKNDAMRF